jgi:hypothetical protein
MKAMMTLVVDINDEPNPNHDEWVSYDKYVEARQIAIANITRIVTNFAHTGNLHEIKKFVEGANIQIAKNPKPRWENVVKDDANEILAKHLKNIVDIIYNGNDDSLYDKKIDDDIINKTNNKMRYTDNTMELLSVIWQLENKTSNDIDRTNEMKIYEILRTKHHYTDLLRSIITNAATVMYKRALENRVYGTLYEIRYSIDVSQIKDDILNEVLDQDDDETMDAYGLNPDDTDDCIKYCTQVKEYEFENRVKQEIALQIEEIMNDEEDDEDDYP